MKNFTKKILIAHSSNDKYGSSKILISVVDLFIKNGFEVHLFLPFKGPLNNEPIIKKTKLNIINLGVFRRKYFNFLGLINRFIFIINSSIYLTSYIRKNKIDFVYVNTSTIISPLIASKICSKDSLCHIHEIPNNSYFYSKFISFFLNYFTKNNIAVSNSVLSFWLGKGVNKKNIKIIHNGFLYNINTNKEVSKSKIVFTSISRIIPYKGHLLLISIFEKICSKNKDIQLQIVGDTLPEYQNYLNDLKLLVQKKGLNKKILFTGFKDDIISILSKSNFFIHIPISPDPFPTVIFEAIGTKTPVITNELGGAYEILNNGKNGLIINNDLIEDSVNKILNYVERPKVQAKNVENALNYVQEKFSLKKFEKKILKIIE